MGETRRPLVVCADDFAISDGVSRAIADLARRGRLGAVGCMTASPSWPAAARLLGEFEDRCDVGVHLTLTDQPPLGRLPRLAPGGRLPSLPRLMALAFAGRLTGGDLAREIGAEIDRQLDAFAVRAGRHAEFVDGHQHVHLLPGVRDRVLQVVSPGGAAAGAWLRVCRDPLASIVRRGVAVPKAAFLAALSRPLWREVRRRELPANDGFRGVHDFRPDLDYGRLFRRFLVGDDRGRRPLLMCHPGFVDDRLRAADRVTEARVREYAYLASSRLDEDLSRAGVHLARMRDLLVPSSTAPGRSR